MKYIDYEWDIHPDKIMLDEELDVDKLGWKGGDHFELQNINGRAQLVKVDPVVKFVRGYK